MRRRPPHSGKRLAGRPPRRAGAPSASRPDVEQLTAYLDLLAGAEPSNALLEVRVRHPGQQTMRRWFVEIGARQRLVTQLPVIGAHADVYLGCAPRQMRSGTREAVNGGWVAWADVDGPNSARSLSSFAPEPTLIVASGSPGAAHAYWRLAREPTSPSSRRSTAASPTPLAATRSGRPPRSSGPRHLQPQAHPARAGADDRRWRCRV